MHPLISVRNMKILALLVRYVLTEKLHGINSKWQASASYHYNPTNIRMNTRYLNSEISLQYWRGNKEV